MGGAFEEKMGDLSAVITGRSLLPQEKLESPWQTPLGTRMPPAIMELARAGAACVWHRALFSCLFQSVPTGNLTDPRRPSGSTFIMGLHHDLTLRVFITTLLMEVKAP